VNDSLKLKKLAEKFNPKPRKEIKQKKKIPVNILSFSSTISQVDTSIPEKYLKKKEPKEVSGGTIDVVWGFYRNIIVLNFPRLALPKRPMGKDTGHIKNLVRYANKDMAKLKQMVKMFCMDWHNAQKKWPCCARCSSPTLYLMDTLKRDLFGFLVAGGITDGTQARHSEYAKEEGYGFEGW